MGLIDDQGKLFGLVNIIDAFAILVVVSIILAGVAVVIQPEPEPTPQPEPRTMQAVVDLGTQPSYIAERISEGDTSSPGADTLVVTGVYVTPVDGGARTLLTVNLTSSVGGNTFTYNGQPLRLGRELSIVTDVYQVTGSIRAVDTYMNSGRTDVLVAATVDSNTGLQIEPNDTYSLAGREIATVASVQTFATPTPEQFRVFVGLSLRTVDLGNGPQFANTQLRPGTSIPFRTEEYAFSGDIRRVGSTVLRGDPATRTVRLEMANVDPQIASVLHAGMTETVGEATVARLVSVETEPATVVLTSQDGSIYRREHPVNKAVALTAELQIRETSTGLTFKGQALQQGETIVLNLGTTTVEARVVDL